jgi:hypothetical protein
VLLGTGPSAPETTPDASPPSLAAELIASSMGLGFLLIDSQNTGRTDVMLLAIILLALIGKLSDTLLGLAGFTPSAGPR